MKKKKSIYLIVTGLAACGLCCLPLLFPAAVITFGASLFSFSIASLICGTALLFLAILLFGIYRAKMKKACDLPTS